MYSTPATVRQPEEAPHCRWWPRTTKSQSVRFRWVCTRPIHCDHWSPCTFMYNCTTCCIANDAPVRLFWDKLFWVACVTHQRGLISPFAPI